jgi:hypothetical protein
MDRIRNEYIRGSLKVAPVTEKIRSIKKALRRNKKHRLAWFDHVMWRDESLITRRGMSMNVDGHPRRGRPKKRWMDCVNDENKRSEHGDDE